MKANKNRIIRNILKTLGYSMLLLSVCICLLGNIGSNLIGIPIALWIHAFYLRRTHLALAKSLNYAAIGMITISLIIFIVYATHEIYKNSDHAASLLLMPLYAIVFYLELLFKLVNHGENIFMFFGEVFVPAQWIAAIITAIIVYVIHTTIKHRYNRYLNYNLLSFYGIMFIYVFSFILYANLSVYYAMRQNQLVQQTNMKPTPFLLMTHIEQQLQSIPSLSTSPCYQKPRPQYFLTLINGRQYEWSYQILDMQLAQDPLSLRPEYCNK